VTSPLETELLEAQRYGAIGPAPLSEHIAHALAFGDLLGVLPAGSNVLDLGSGGGLPGLVLAGQEFGWSVALLEGRTERARHLQSAIERLGWSERVTVLAERAELTGRGPHRATFDAVVARGFARPAVTAECAAPLLRVGGLLVVSEPPDGTADLRWPVPAVAQLGLALEDYLHCPFSFALLRQLSLCPQLFPRRVGIPAKRPLF
jgi:16S rRNA (guanine527-N7)-methyltransferase